MKVPRAEPCVLRKVRWIETQDKIVEVETGPPGFKKRNTGMKKFKMLMKIKGSEGASSFPLIPVHQKPSGVKQGW